MVKKQHIMSVDEQNKLQWQVKELEMWIDNTYELYQRKMAFFKNYWRKYKAGKFNSVLAAKGFAMLTDAAARNYNNQDFGAEYKISTQARRIVDKRLVDEFLDAVQNKEYDFMGYVPKVR